jgi:hypothetical protein
VSLTCLQVKSRPVVAAPALGHLVTSACAAYQQSVAAAVKMMEDHKKRAQPDGLWQLLLANHCKPTAATAPEHAELVVVLRPRAIMCVHARVCV